MKKTKTLLAMLLAFLLLASAGCSPSDPGAQNTDGEPSAAADPTQEPTPSESEPEESLDPELVDMVKYNIYVEMNNKIVDVLDTLYSYYEVVEYADEFALRSDSEYTYKYDISPYNTDLLEEAEYVAVLEPAFETLDDLTLQIIDPLRTLMDTFSDIYSDYSYADDQYARPKEYHKAIQANAAVFEDLAYQYMDALEELSIQRVEKEEKEMQEEGRLLIYGFSHSITVVKRITAECYNQGISDYNIEELNLEPIRPLYQELLDTIEAYKAAAEDNNQLMEESMSADNAYHYGTQMDRMASAIDWMIRQVESGYPIEDPGREFLGGLIHVEEVLSDCIDLYNSAFAS
ncbi:MAG: YiiG family protein [Oscillospiraceae bacterium]|nr:YiiG family protein [Oscillospiraceae bacterium]